MWLVTIRGLIANKLRFVMMGVAVMIGVAFMSGTMVLTDTMGATFDDLFGEIFKSTDALVRSCDVVDAEFIQTRAKLPETLLEEVRAVDGVAEADPIIEGVAHLVGADGELINDPSQGPPVIGFNWRSSPLNAMKVVEGRGPESDDEVVIDLRASEQAKLGVGDEIKVLTKTVTEGKPKVYRISGVARFGTAKSPGGATVTMFTFDEAQRVLGEPGMIDRVMVKAEDGVDSRTIADRIEKLVGGPEIQVLTGEEAAREQANTFKDSLSFVNSFLLAFVFVALFVGAFIISNTFSIVVAQRTKEMATLRMLGASRWQVTSAVLGESVAVGILASAVGIGFGLLVSIGLKALMGAFGIEIPASELVVERNSVLIPVAVGMVVTLASAALPARRAARISPLAAVREVSVDRLREARRRSAIGIGSLAVGVGAIFWGLIGATSKELWWVGLGAVAVFLGTAGLAPLLARPIAAVLGAPAVKTRGVVGVLARGNVARNPRRSAATASALMVSVALVSLIMVMTASMNASVGSFIDKAIKGDYIVSTGTFFAGGGLPIELAERLRELPEVEALTPIRIGIFELTGPDAGAPPLPDPNGPKDACPEVASSDASGILAGIDATSADKVIDLGFIEGETLDLLSGGVAVSKALATDHGWEVGELIHMKFADTGEQKIRLVGIFDSPTSGDYLVDLSTFSENYLDQFDFRLNIAASKGVTEKDARSAIEALVTDYPNAKVLDQGEFKDEFAKSFAPIIGLMYALLFFSTLIALIGVANTLTLSILERTREIGLLRAVGTTRRQLRTMIRIESVMLALFGATLGIVIGIFFGWALVTSFADEGFDHLVLPPISLSLVTVLAAILGVIASVLPARRAARLNVLDSISAE